MSHDPYEDLKVAFAILEKYTEYERWVSSEHDQIFLGGPPQEHMDAADLKELEKHCIWWDSDVESWYVFT